MSEHSDEKFKVEKLLGSPLQDDEPVFVFRAQDKFMAEVLVRYADMCHLGGASEAYVQAIWNHKGLVSAWQADHQIKIPD